MTAPQADLIASDPLPASVRDLSEIDLIEMANVSTKDTGIEGVISITTVQGSHGARVKWCPGRPGRDTPSLSVTVAQTAQVVSHNRPARVVAAAGTQVVVWVSLNRPAVLEFWNNGESWTRDDVNAFIDGLQKLS